MSHKSIIDGMKMDDKVFPLTFRKKIEEERKVSVVSECPKCGAPIYGPEEVRNASEAKVIRSCNCFSHAPTGEMKTT